MLMCSVVFQWMACFVLVLSFVFHICPWSHGRKSQGTGWSPPPPPPPPPHELEAHTIKYIPNQGFSQDFRIGCPKIHIWGALGVEFLFIPLHYTQKIWIFGCPNSALGCQKDTRTLLWLKACPQPPWFLVLKTNSTPAWKLQIFCVPHQPTDWNSTPAWKHPKSKKKFTGAWSPSHHILRAISAHDWSYCM